LHTYIKLSSACNTVLLFLSLFAYHNCKIFTTQKTASSRQKGFLLRDLCAKKSWKMEFTASFQSCINQFNLLFYTNIPSVHNIILRIGMVVLYMSMFFTTPKLTKKQTKKCVSFISFLRLYELKITIYLLEPAFHHLYEEDLYWAFVLFSSKNNSSS
jgi:hypothetical protein